MFVLVSMQLSNHVHTTSEAFQALKWLCDMYISHIYAILNLEFRKCIKFKISLRKLSGGAAHLRTLEGTLIVTHGVVANEQCYNSGLGCGVFSCRW